MTSAIVVIPQAIAFAAIAGMPIQYGLYTAIVIPVVAALLGSSKHMISGPTTAISILVFGSLAESYTPGTMQYVKAALLLTLMAGVFQVGMGLLRLGALANFVSDSVMLGFTAGAAVIILFTQIPVALGMPVILPGETTDLTSVLDSLAELGVSAGVTALIAMAAALLSRRLWAGSPHYLIGLMLAAVYCGLVDNADVDFVAPVNSALPVFAWVELNFADIRNLAPSAFALALVGLLEATAIARSLSLKSGQDIAVNQEFFGQGMSNIVGSFFSAFMGSGSFTRSALNFEAGARTPLSAVFASLFLFLIVVSIGQWFSVVPIPAIAGIILLVAWRLIDIDEIRNVLKTSGSSSAVMLTTFFSTVIVGLEFGIYLGVFVSLSLFLRRSASPYLAMTAPDPASDGRYFRNAPAFNLDECPQLGCARLDGVLYFGSLEEVRRQLRELEYQRPLQKSMLMMLKGVADIDMPGAKLLIAEAQRRRARGGALYITVRQRQIQGSFGRNGVIAAIGSHAAYANKGEAIQDIVPRLDPEVCAKCDKRIFRECPPPAVNNHASAENKAV